VISVFLAKACLDHINLIKKNFQHRFVVVFGEMRTNPI
jgi:hypothetical protein